MEVVPQPTFASVIVMTNKTENAAHMAYLGGFDFSKLMSREIRKN